MGAELPAAASARPCDAGGITDHPDADTAGPAMARLAILTGLALMALGAVPLIGWIASLRSLTMWMFDRAPVRPCVAAVFLLVGTLVIESRGRLRRCQRQLAALALLLLGLFGLVSTTARLDTPLDGWLLGHRDWYDAAAGAERLPLLTAITMTSLGAAIALLRRRQQFAHGLLVATLFAAYVSLIGQLFGASDAVSLGNPATMPATTALGVGLGAVAIAAGTPPRGLLRYLTDRGSAGVLVRPVVVVVPVAIPAVAWALLLAHEAGYLDHPTVVAFVGGSGLLIATALAWWAAARLRALDNARTTAYRRLAATNAALEQRVADRTAEVERRTALFTLAFESASVGMALLDLSGCIVRANSALAAMTGRSVADLALTPFSSLLHGDDGPTVEEQRRLMTSGLVSECAEELRLTTGRGGFRWATATGSVLRDGGGSPLQILVHLTDIDERKTQEYHLAHLANHDPLTGLLNRRGFTPLLDAQVAHVARYGDAGALLAIDLDNFKAVNDRCGHDCGDELLVAVAAALRRSLRASDSVARAGGDEFVALLPDADAVSAPRIAQILIAAVRAQSEGLRTSHGVVVTASVGVALFGASSLSGTDVLRRADRAMYAAKEAGRDRWALDEPPK